jgi:hypothetical protein
VTTAAARSRVKNFMDDPKMASDISFTLIMIESVFYACSKYEYMIWDPQLYFPSEGSCVMHFYFP